MDIKGCARAVPEVHNFKKSVIRPSLSSLASYHGRSLSYEKCTHRDFYATTGFFILVWSIPSTFTSNDVVIVTSSTLVIFDFAAAGWGGAGEKVSDAADLASGN